ncbi:glycosyltransferase [Segatella buccae]|jgi:putative colanic acid biosynthesis glycosyltransferase
MRVLQIAVASTGGIGRLTRDISDVLTKNGIDNKIAYGRGGVLDPARDFMFGSKPEIYFHALMSRLDDACGLWSKHGTRQLIDFIENYKPNLVQLHNLHGYYINVEMLFRYLHDKKIPTVWTLHDCWCLTGHCVHFTFVKCYEWMQKCGDCPQINTYPKSYVDRSKRNLKIKEKAFSSLCDMTIITPSEWLMGLIRRSYLNKYSGVVINNGIDLDVFRVKPKLGYADKKIILGLASTWSKRKGFDDMIALSRMLLNDEYQVMMVGVKKEQLKHIPQNVRAILHTESIEQLVNLYNEAFIFVNPTYEDNFPTTNLESMACGTSVITYNTGGSVESVTEETGYIVPQGDIKGIAEIIVKHKKTKESIINCRHRAEKYDKKYAYNKYLELYKLILKI